MPYVLPISKYTTLNIRGTKFCITRLSASSWATRSCQRSKRSCRLAACRLSTCSCRLSTCMIFHICPYVAMSLSCRMFYLFRRFCPVMPCRNTKFCITRLSASSWATPAVQAFMQAACRLSTCSCRLSTPSCSMSIHSCRLPVLSDLLGPSVRTVLMLTGERLCQNSTI